MTFGKRTAGVAALGTAVAIGAGLSARPSQAAYIVTLTEAGGDVVANGSGSIDTAGLTFIGTEIDSAAITPAIGAIVLGPTTATASDIYHGSLPSFGIGGGAPANVGSGDLVGTDSGDLLYLPSGYASGDPLSDTATWTGQTFASLGVTPGTYVLTWGSGATADSFTLIAGVPEPSSALLLVLPLGFLGLLLAARHRTGARDQGMI
jgi:hypothetical protein